MPLQNLVLVVMGVSGSGKTTIGTLLAERLGWPYGEADDMHSAANRAKMSAGKPLDDEDRRPWLEAIGAWVDAREEAHESGVVSCSALKRSYRDFLRKGRPEVICVYLDGSRELIASRLSERQGHFMKAAMLDSQFADLEPPTPDEENVISVDIAATPEEIVDRIVAALPEPYSSSHRAPV